MGRFLSQRLLQFALVVFGATLVSYIAMFVATDPARTALPTGASPADVAAFRAEYGFDRPVLQQYASYMWNALHGDFGTSLWLGQPTLEVVLASLPATAAIAIPATVIGCLLGVGFGIASSMRPGGRFDNMMNVISYGMISLAEFWLAMILILIFAVQLGLVPAAAQPGTIASFVLPVLVLAIRPFAHQMQMMRASMLSERTKQYVSTARSKGLSDSRIAYRHVLRNAAIPSVTLACYEMSRVFVGTAVAVEVVFSWPGIGQLGTEALQRGDIFLVQGVVVIAAVMVGLLNLTADLLGFWLDPRTRTSIQRSNRIAGAKVQVAA